MNIFIPLRVVSFISFFSLLSAYGCNEQYTARSFMFTRPASFNQSMHQSVWHNVHYTGKGDYAANHNISFFYQKSIAQHQAEQYFLLNGKREISIAGDIQTQDITTRDVRAEWLGLSADFKGTLSLSPRQQQIGAWFEYNQQLRYFTDSAWFDNAWIALTVPLVFLDNNLNPCYTTLQNSSQTTLQHAFNNPNWLYGKIHKEHSRVGISEIKVTFGRTFIDQDSIQLGYESSFIIPTSPKQTGTYLFDAVLGLNGHAAFGNKLTAQIVLNRNPLHTAWTFFTNFEAFLLLPNRQHRTFDLRTNIHSPRSLQQNQWSRYLMYTNQEGTVVPGVNLLTRKVTVNPYTVVDLCVGWRLKSASFECEIGYNLWAHSQETLDNIDCSPYLSNKSVPQWGILGSTPGITASNSTIDTQAADDTVFTPFRESQIDLHSGAAACAINHKIHASFGLIKQGCKTDSFISVGGFFEIPQKNSALMNYGLWGKIGASF